MERMGLERQILEWVDWDDDGPMKLILHEVTLKITIGSFPVGHKFATAFFDGDASVISFMDENDQEYSFELKLSIGDKVEPHQVH